MAQRGENAGATKVSAQPEPMAEREDASMVRFGAGKLRPVQRDKASAGATTAW